MKEPVKSISVRDGTRLVERTKRLVGAIEEEIKRASSRELSLAYTKAQECLMWLEKDTTQKAERILGKGL